VDVTVPETSDGGLGVTPAVLESVKQLLLAPQAPRLAAVFGAAVVSSSASPTVQNGVAALVPADAMPPPPPALSPAPTPLPSPLAYAASPPPSPAVSGDSEEAGFPVAVVVGVAVGAVLCIAISIAVYVYCRRRKSVLVVRARVDKARDSSPGSSGYANANTKNTQGGNGKIISAHVTSRAPSAVDKPAASATAPAYV